MTVVDDLTTAVQSLISRAQTTVPSDTLNELTQVKVQLDTIEKGVQDVIRVINSIEVSVPSSNMENQPEEAEKEPS